MATDVKAATELCAWCSKIITHGDMLKPFTHGICKDCTKTYFPVELAGIQAECDHDYVDLKVEHEEDDEPVAMTSTSIIRRVSCFEIYDAECSKCGDVVKGETRDCEAHKED